MAITQFLRLRLLISHAKPSDKKQSLGTNVRSESDNGFGIWGNPLFATILIFAWFGLLKDFRLNPQFDRYVSSLFYDPATCAKAALDDSCFAFPLHHNEVLNLVRDILHLAPNFIGAILLVFLVIQYWEGKRWDSQPIRNQTVVLATLLLGPLVTVNFILKEIFGRVRPRGIQEFGGAMDFTLPGDIAGQCLSNCSFVSGEASIGGWFLVCGLLFPPQYRKKAYVGLFVIGFSMAMLRVTFGAHFLSDALLGYLIPIIICAILASIIDYLQKEPSVANS